VSYWIPKCERSVCACVLIILDIAENPCSWISDRKYFPSQCVSFSSELWITRTCLFFLISWGGVRLSPLGTSATVGLLYQPRMIDDDDYGAVDGIRIGKGNRSTRRKPAPVPLCPPQIPHDLTWDRTRAAAVGGQWLTAWAMARPELVLVWLY
jgi:hypothetical protein